MLGKLRNLSRQTSLKHQLLLVASVLTLLVTAFLLVVRLSDSEPQETSLMTFLAESGRCRNVGRLVELQPPYDERRPAPALRQTLIRLERERRSRGDAEMSATGWAMLDLCLGEPERALERLRDREATEDPKVSAVVGAAHLELAVRDGTAMDLLHAARWFRQTLDHHPADLPALTHLSQVLDRLGLVQTQRRLLRRLMELETSPLWRARHIRVWVDLEKRISKQRAGEETFHHAATVLTAAGRGDSELADRVAKHPYLARKLVEEKLLGNWGIRWEKGDLHKAERELEAALRIASILRQHSGDPVLEQAATEIRAAVGARRERLARAFSAFQHGMRIYRGRHREPEEAVRLFESAADLLKKEGIHFAAWAEHYALVLRSFNERDATSARWRELLDQAPESFLALRGHFAWRLGLARQMAGDAAGALPFFEASIPDLEAVSGRRGAAFAHVLMANALGDLDLVEQSFRRRLRANDLLLHTRDYWQCHSLLHATVHALVRGREPRLAFPFLDELEINASLWGFPSALSEFHFIKARVLAAIGAFEPARHHIGQGRVALENYPQGPIVDWLLSDADIAEGTTWAREDPWRAVQLIRRGYESQRKMGYHYEKIPVLAGLDLAGRARQDVVDSKGLQDQLIGELIRLRDELQDPSQRAVAGNVLEKVVALVLEESTAQDTARDAEEWIAMLDLLKPGPRPRSERGDGPQIEPWSRADGGEWLSRVQARLGPGEQVVAYHLGSEHLWISVLDQKEVNLIKKQIGGRIRQRARNAVQALDAKVGGEPIPWIGELADDLLGGLDLSDTTRLIVVPDRDLQSLPWQALPIGGPGRPLIADLEVVYFPSLRLLEHARSLSRPSRLSDAALFVGSPIMSPPLRVQLGDLIHTQREIQTLATLYPESQMLSGPQATVSRAIIQLDQARIAHFAVHAAPGGPGSNLAGLILSPDEIHPSGLLSLSDLAEADLSGLHLLVLSGCSTALGYASGRAVLWGLPAIALDSGAQAVLATHAPIEDQQAPEFAERFHRNFLRTHDPARAYAEAARSFLEEFSEKPGERPSIWMYYQLIGG